MVSLPIISPKSESQDTRLIAAAKRGDVSAVRDLISHGLNVDDSDSTGLTALAFSAMAGHPKVVQILLDAGADPAKTDDDGWDIYERAMFYGDFKGVVMPPHDKIMKAILKAGYKPRNR